MNPTTRYSIAGRLAWMVGLGTLLVAALAPAGLAQSGPWSAHTPFREATGLSTSDEAVWVSTRGGVFSYDLNSGEIRAYTTTHGLYGIDADEILYDPACACVWIGYGDGVMDRLIVETGVVTTYLDIARAEQFSQKGINTFVSKGDTLFVGTDFGLVVFDTRALEVRDAFTKFGDLDVATAVQDVLIDQEGGNRLWVATDQGLVHASLESANLREPAAWTAEAGLPVQETKALAQFDGAIYVGTASDAYRLTPGGDWVPANLSGNAVFALEADDDVLIALETFSLVTLQANGQRQRWFLRTESDFGDLIPYESPRHVQVGPNGRYWVADEREGLLGFDAFPASGDQLTQTQPVKPKGPFNGLFTDLVFDAAGALWVAGSPGRDTGFHRFVDGVWTDYIARFYSELEGTASFDFIHADAQGNLWAGSAGRGLAQVDSEGRIVTYDQSNSTLEGAPGSPEFIRILGIASEPDGTLWVINEFNPFPLHVRLPDGSWQDLPPLRAAGLPASLAYEKIFIDSYNQKWILPKNNEGLIVLDTRGTPTDTGDDTVRYFRGRGIGGTGLPDVNVTSWVEDRTGRVWIGTHRGIAFYLAPNLVLSNDPGAFQAQWPTTLNDDGTRSFLLRDLSVNDLAVDPANQKWIASDNGVWLINSEGDAVLRHFTTDNSPLLSDRVLAVAVDERDGRVYFATNKGMVSWQGEAVAPNDEPEPLFIYPNPVRAEAGVVPDIYIDGLVSETDVRIVSTAGTLVHTLEARGGRVRWDGRDRLGEPVPSGVYLVVAVGKNGEGTAYGKLAVIR